MQGDEAEPAHTGGTPDTRSGPRHAAPRKSLLTRVHVPAGKAIALAAMPTAVLMGMGLTPRLAQADELPKNPFKGSSCVTRSDSPAPQDSSSATASPSVSSISQAAPTKAGTLQTRQAHPKAATQPTSGATGSPAAGTSTPTASPIPSATRSTNPLDPLGLGNLINGVATTVTGSGSTGSPSPTPTASPTAKTGTTGTTGNGSTSSNPVGTVKQTVQHATGTVSGVFAGAAQTLPTATASASPSPSATDGSQGYPCPTYNAAAQANASLEQTPALLPNDAWILKTDLLTLTGLDYHGVVKVKTWNGTVKTVLKFTATGVDIRNLHQITNGPDGVKFHVQARFGSTSTIRNGMVTMYTEELKGNLFGLIPVTFTPSSPPPLNVSAAFFTDVTVTQAGQFGGTLTVPGMHLYRGA